MRIIPLFAAFNLLDYLTTTVGIQRGFQELNSFVEKLDPISFLSLKFFIIATLFLIAVELRKRVQAPLIRGAYYGLIIGVTVSTVFLAVAALHNLLLLMGFKEVEVVLKIMSAVFSPT